MNSQFSLTNLGHLLIFASQLMANDENNDF